jgi:hypothetical protein
MANGKAKGLAKKVKGGFFVEPTPEYLAKKEREDRMNARKTQEPQSTSNTDIFEYLQDIASRQEEIYDLLKDK